MCCVDNVALAARIANVRADTSQSQITNYVTCPRRWFMSSVMLACASASTPQMEEGTHIHKVLEIYIENGEWVGTPHRIAAAQSALAYLPKRGPGVELEKSISVQFGDGLPTLGGFADFIEWLTDPTTVGDYKDHGRPTLRQAR